MSGGRDIRQDLRKKPTGGVELIAVYTKGHPGYHGSVLRRSRREDPIFSNAAYNDDTPSASYLSPPSPGSPGYRNNSRSENSSAKSTIGGKTIRDTGWYNIKRTDDSDETTDGIGPFRDLTRSNLRYSAGKIGHTQRKHTNSNVSYDTKTIVPKYPVGRDIGLTEAALLWMKVRARRGKHQADTRFFQEEDEAGYDMECAQERYCTMRKKVSQFEKEAFQGQRGSAYDEEDEEEGEEGEESLVCLDVSGIEKWRSVTGSGKPVSVRTIRKICYTRQQIWSGHATLQGRWENFKYWAVIERRRLDLSRRIGIEHWHATIVQEITLHRAIESFFAVTCIAQDNEETIG